MSQRMRSLPMLAGCLCALAAGGRAEACACGCGLFDVGTSSMFATTTGGMLFVDDVYMDQNRDWGGSHSAPASANSDLRIATQFGELGGQYLFNRAWGVSVELPYWSRTFTTTLDDGAVATFHHSAPGDLRIKAIYTGLEPDLSTGLTFGLKLPTGDSTYANFDPDTSIGSGSTDLLLGGYHIDRLTGDGRWTYFVQAQWQEPVRSKANYRPGGEVDGAAGLYYEGLGSARWTLTPILQLNASVRARDGGPDAAPDDSGYRRLVLNPGLELAHGDLRVYLGAGFSVVNDVNGYQLIAREYFRLTVSTHF
jgi:hypothetical protein